MKLLFCLILFLFGIVTFPVYAQKSKQLTKAENDEFKSPFRYVIVAGVTELEQYVNRFPKELLTFEVLIKDKDFTEKNLKILFELLGKRYNSTSGLGIWVYTSLDAIKTPEENDHSDLKGPVSDYFNYKNAYFMRDSNANEYFEYTVPGSERKRVVMKGCYKCK